MNALIIDTTTVDLTVIVVKGDQIFDGSIKGAKTAHSELLCTTVSNALKMAELTFAQLDLYACAIGPGSFTGIRIGVSTTKGYNRACPKQLIAIDNLHLLAFAQGEGEYAAIIDAGNGWYYGKYNGLKCIEQPCLIPYDDPKATTATKGDNSQLPQSVYVNYVKQMAQSGNFVNQLVPLYIRKSQAEDNEKK